MRKQSKRNPVNFFSKGKWRPCAQFNLIHLGLLCMAGGESIGKHVKIEAILKEEEEEVEHCT